MNNQAFLFNSWITLICISFLYFTYLTRNEILSYLGFKSIPQKLIRKLSYKKKDVEANWKELLNAVQENELKEDIWKIYIEYEREQKKIIDNRIKVLEIIGTKTHFKAEPGRIKGATYLRSIYFQNASRKQKKIIEKVNTIATLEALAGHDIQEANLTNLQ